MRLVFVLFLFFWSFSCFGQYYEYRKARILHQTGNPQQAETEYLKAIKICDTLGLINTGIMLSCYQGISSLYSQEGDTRQEESYRIKALSIDVSRNESNDFDRRLAFQELMINAEVAFRSGAVSDALKAGQEALALAALEDTLRFEYLDAATKLAFGYFSIGDLDKMEEISYLSLSTAIGFDQDGPNFLGIILLNLANVSLERNDFEEAIELFQKVLWNYENKKRELDDTYFSAVGGIGLVHYKLGNYRKAKQYFEYSLEGMMGLVEVDKLSSDDMRLLTLLSNVATVSVSLGEIGRAEELFFRALEMMESDVTMIADSIKYNPNTFAVYSGLGDLYSTTGRLNESVKFYRKSLNELAGLNKTVPNEIRVRVSLGTALIKQGNYAEAEFELLEAYKLQLALSPQNQSNLSSVLAALGTLYQIVGDFDKAENYLTKSIDLSKKFLGEYHPQYWTALSGLGAFYFEFGVFDKAFLYTLLAERLVEESESKDYLDYYRVILGNLAFGYGKAGDWDNQLIRYEKQKTFLEANGMVRTSDYALNLNNRATTLMELQDLVSAEELLIESINLYQELDMDSSIERALALSNLSYNYSEQGKDLLAESYAVQAMNVRLSKFGRHHTSYLSSISELGYFYSRVGRHHEAADLYQEEQLLRLSTVGKNLTFLSEKEKAYYLDDIRYHFQYWRSFYHKFYSEEPSISQYSFDLELTIKDMVLRSNMDMRQSISISADPAFVNSYSEWLGLMDIISRENNLPVGERRSDIDSIENKAEKLEKQLSRLSKDFKEFREQVTWDMVRNELVPGEAAIEFSSFDYINSKGNWTDSTLYTALVLKPNDQYPHMVTLFEQRELDALFDTSASIAMLYGSRGAVPVPSDAAMSYGEDLYDLVWSPLDSLLEGVDRVYFSPSGSLHKLSFSAIPYSGESLLSDRYDLNRVSSTAVLTRSSIDERPKDMVLFGGMNYSMDTLEMKELAMATGSDLYSRGLPPDLERGGESWSYLPGTLEEVQSISTLATQKGIQVTTHTGNDALEERFKALGGDSPDIVHLATHGFFYPDPEKEKRDGRMMLGNETSSFKLSDDPLNRAGILFSGANAYWNGQDVPDGIDNGVLTAKEATYVSLQNTELLVLSACETGLGEIQGSEGVFGLQRAFRASGADNLLMSLWKVPDQETSEFMESFYGHYLSDHTIPDSYYHAQRAMREKYPNDPYKWAGFVLMR